MERFLLKGIYENYINNNIQISKLKSLDNINYMSSIFFQTCYRDILMLSKTW